MLNTLFKYHLRVCLSIFYKARPNCRFHFNKASILGFATEQVEENMSKQAKPRNVATSLNRAKVEYLSSIVFHTVLVAKKYVSRTVWNTIDDRYSIWRTKLEYLSSIVFHTVLVEENMSKQAKPRNVATSLNRAKLEYLSSTIFNTVLVAKQYVSMTLWNTIDERYSIWRTKLEYLSSIVFNCPSGK